MDGLRNEPWLQQNFTHLSRPALKAHPAFYTMGTRSFTVAKQPAHGINHPPPRVIPLFLLCAFMAGYSTNFTFYLCLGNE